MIENQLKNVKIWWLNLTIIWAYSSGFIYVLTPFYRTLFEQCKSDELIPALCRHSAWAAMSPRLGMSRQYDPIITLLPFRVLNCRVRNAHKNLLLYQSIFGLPLIWSTTMLKQCPVSPIIPVVLIPCKCLPKSSDIPRSIKQLGTKC